MDALLTFVRQTIEAFLETGTLPIPHPSSKKLDSCRGCFVTLRKHRRLRGCIGTFDSSRPLRENLTRMAVAAAFEDPRFPPVAKSELADLDIEISVLGEPWKMKTIDELVIGKHGVIVKYGVQSGTYLPDVAVEQKWSPEEFIRHCACEKTGLSCEEAAEAEVYLYEVEKFSEKKGRTQLE